MYENVVYPSYEIPTVSFIFLGCLLRAQAVEKTDLAQHYWVGRLEKVLTDPAKYSVRLKESLGTGCNYGASARYRAITRLLI